MTEVVIIIILTIVVVAILLGWLIEWVVYRRRR